MSSSSTTTPQTAADRLISLSQQQQDHKMSQSLQEKLGDLLQALEADGIYEAGPAGLPCSLLSVTTTIRPAFSPLVPEDVPKMTFVHVMTDMDMLTLLQTLPETWWLRYLSGVRRLSLVCSNSQHVRTTEYHKAGEELGCIDEYPEMMQGWGLTWWIHD